MRFLRPFAFQAAFSTANAANWPYVLSERLDSLRTVPTGSRRRTSGVEAQRPLYGVSSVHDQRQGVDLVTVLDQHIQFHQIPTVEMVVERSIATAGPLLDGRRSPVPLRSSADCRSPGPGYRGTACRAARHAFDAQGNDVAQVLLRHKNGLYIGPRMSSSRTGPEAWTGCRRKLFRRS